MDASLNNYLKSLLPNWNYNENPLYRAEVDYLEEQPFNYFANKILSDMSEVSLDAAMHPREFICQIFKLNTLIRAYNFIESAACDEGAPDGMINELKYKEFTEYKNSLRRLGLEEGQFEDVADEFQRLSMVDVPKEHIYENQIHKMVTLARTYLNDQNNDLDIDSVDNEGCTQFCRVCMSGEFEKAKLLLSLGCNPNIPDLIYTACEKGITELVDFLIKEGNIDPNIKYQDCSPLYIACCKGFDNIVSIIAKSKRANLNTGYKGQTPFAMAIHKGYEGCARILMEAGVDINAPYADESTLFNLAVENKNVERAKLLLSLGCNPNIPNAKGITPFYSACNNGMTEIVDILIKRDDVDPDIKCQGYPPLFVACELGHDEIVSIIAKSKRANLYATYNDRTPFEIAIDNGHEKCARILLEAGVKINAPYADESTLFGLAIENKNVERAKLLLSLGCNPNIPNARGFTPFYYACRNGITEIVDILIKRDDVDPNIECKDCSPLYIACNKGFDKVVSILVNSKKIVNLETSYKGLTPFDAAIYNGHEGCARILIKAGVDINARDNAYRSTLFNFAIDNKNVERAKLLLSLGCNPNIPNIRGFTPFYSACRNGMTEIVDILIKRGDVDPNIQCQDCPPIFTACDNGFDEIVSIIVKSNRANLYATYNDRTPFEIAIDKGNEKCARILLEARVDINAKNKSGRTLFHSMVLNANLKVAKMLLSLGCDPNIPGSEGYTPFYTACNKGMTELVDILINRYDVDPNIQCQGCPPIASACNHGFDKIVSILAKSKRVDLNADYKGKTPFTIAIDKGNEKCARILLEASVDINKKDKIDINAKDKSGKTLFHSMVFDANLKLAKMLLSLGCNPNIPSSEGHTPFYDACAGGSAEIVSMLVESGKVDPNIRVLNCPPIASACDHGFDKIVSILAKSKRADLNAIYKGLTPFAITIHKGHEGCARILMEAGANINEQYADKRTLFHIYVRKRNLEKTKMLLSLGCDPNIPDQEGITPFYYACCNGMTEVVEMLVNSGKVDLSLKKETLDPFCLFIVDSLKKGSFKEFRNFLNYGKSFYENTVERIIDFLKLEVDKTIANIMQRYEQISQVEIEKAGNLKKIDKLKLAYLIEIDIPKFRHVSHKELSQSYAKYPRTIIVEQGSQQLLILAKKQFSIISGEGGFKYVKSALLVPQNRYLRVQRVVHAKIIQKTKKGALETQKEYELLKNFSGFTGFGEVYKFFCFDRNGDYLNSQQLGNKSHQEKIRTALVLEEMEGDFRKVVTQLTLNEQVSVTKQLVEAINIMARKENVSWDLKQSNVLFRRDVQSNEIKIAITDLGCAEDIRQGVVEKANVYATPWRGAPELLYATEVVDDAKGYLKCEIWALGLVMYAMRFKMNFPLIDNKFSNNYGIYQHLPVVKQVSHYALSYNEYVQKHNDLIEKPLKDLLLIPKEGRTPEQNLEILTYSMLRLDRNIRMTPIEADDFCREHF